jgi:hypothetical protein
MPEKPDPDNSNSGINEEIINDKSESKQNDENTCCYDFIDKTKVQCLLKDESILESEDKSKTDSEVEKEKTSDKNILYGGFDYILDKNRNPILEIITENGDKVIIPYDQSEAKYYHENLYDLQPPSDFDAKKARNLEPKERVKYIQELVLRDKIIEFQVANVNSLNTENLLAVPGFIGSKKEPGTLYINKKTGQIHFASDRTQTTKVWRTTVRASKSALLELAENDFHLFPNAGK